VVKKSGGLTDVALSVISHELIKRGLNEKEIENREHQKQKEKIDAFKKAETPKAPKVWIGFILAAAFLVSEITLIIFFG